MLLACRWLLGFVIVVGKKNMLEDGLLLIIKAKLDMKGNSIYVNNLPLFS